MTRLAVHHVENEVKYKTNLGPLPRKDRLHYLDRSVAQHVHQADDADIELFLLQPRECFAQSLDVTLPQQRQLDHLELQLRSK